MKTSATPFAAIDTIDWSALEGAHGKVPEAGAWLRALASANRSARAKGMRAFEENLVHQGSAYPATAKAAPFIVALIVDPKIPDRAALVELLGRIAVGDPDAFTGFDLRRPDHARTLGDDAGREAYASVEARVERIAELVSDQDVEVRAAVAWLATLFAQRSDVWVRPLRTALAREKEASAAASQILALATLAKLAGCGIDANEFRARIGKAKKLATADQIAAAIACVRLDASDASSATLLEGVKSSKSIAAKPWPPLVDLASKALDERELELPIAELMTRLDTADFGRAQRLSAVVLRKMIGPHSGSTRLLAEVGEDARSVLRLLYRRSKDCQAPRNGSYYRPLGVPAPPELGRWLGLDPPSALEKEVLVEGRALPVWKWLQGYFHGELKAPETLGIVANALSIEEVIEACALVVHECQYDMVNADDLEGLRVEGDRRALSLLADFLASKPGAAVRWAETLIAPDEAWKDRAVATIALARIAKRENRPFPRELAKVWDENYTSSPLLREVVETMDAETRASLVDGTRFLATSVEFRRDGSLVDVPIAAEAWDWADLVPTPAMAKKLVESVLEWVDDGSAKPSERATEVTVAMGKVVVRPIVAALKSKKNGAPVGRAVLIRALERISADAAAPFLSELGKTRKPPPGKPTKKKLEN